MKAAAVVALAILAGCASRPQAPIDETEPPIVKLYDKTPVQLDTSILRCKARVVELLQRKDNPDVKILNPSGKEHPMRMLKNCLIDWGYDVRN